MMLFGLVSGSRNWLLKDMNEVVLEWVCHYDLSQNEAIAAPCRRFVEENSKLQGPAYIDRLPRIALFALPLACSNDGR